MKRSIIGLLCVCVLAIAAQAQTTPPQQPATTAGSVMRITYFDVKNGKNTEHMNFLRTNVRVILEEQKKQGLILDYMFLSQPTTDGPGDWDMAQVVVYKNYADAIDSNPERGAKMNAIFIGHYGSAEARNKASDQLNELRTVVSSQLVRQQILNPMPK